MSLAILISYIILATIPIYFAAVQPWIWAFYVLAMALAVLVFQWSGGSQRPVSRWWIVCGSVFFGWTAFQCVPLPMDLIELISPKRYEVLSEGAALTGVTIGKATISYMPYNSASWWILMLVLSAFYFVLRNGFMQSQRLRLLMKILFVLGAFQALYGILQALIPSIGVFGVTTGGVGLSKGTYINRNHFAGLMEMLFPLCLGFALAFGDWEFQGGQKKKMKQMLASDRETPPLLLGVILVTMLVATLFSQSRAGIMGIVLGFLVFSLVVWIGNKRLPLGFWIGIAAIVGLTFLYGARIGFEDIISRFMAIEGDNTRTKIWAQCMAILYDHPLGIGLLSFKSVFRVYEVGTNVNVTFYQAHNDILQLLLEAGWPGFAALFGAYVGLIGVKFVKVCRMRVEKDPLRFFMAAGALSGLVSLGFHSIFDFNLQMPANAVYFVMLIAVLNACTDRQVLTEQAAKKRRVKRVRKVRREVIGEEFKTQ